MTGDQNGWGEYSRLVLKELETLAKGIEGLKAQIGDLKTELAELKAKEDRVQDIKAWKEKIDEVASPTQMQTKFEEIEELKEFKTRAVTMFMVVQGLMGIAMAIALEIFQFFIIVSHKR